MAFGIWTTLRFSMRSLPPLFHESSSGQKCGGTGRWGVLVQIGKRIGDNGLRRIRKLNGILYLPDVGSKTTSFSSACAGISLQIELPGSGRDFR